jgi:hypothetical protein
MSDDFDGLTGEDLAILGLRRPNKELDGWDWTLWPEGVALRRERDAEYARAMAARKRRVRRPSLESQVRQC